MPSRLQVIYFHGCVHSASGGWPYDPVHCPECLGLPEEVAHTKQALAWGFAVLAVESKNQSYHGRCFSSSGDPVLSDTNEVTWVVQVGGAGGCRAGIKNLITHCCAVQGARWQGTCRQNEGAD